MRRPRAANGVSSGSVWKTGVRGPRITDARFAALAIEHGCTSITDDRDYARFPKLDWREPTS
jgi:hypothetical protein